MGIRVVAGDSVYFLNLDLLGKGEIARVFPAYLEGQDPTQPEWAIKLARDQQHNLYIEREYETLTQLHEAVVSLPKAARFRPEATPLPRVQLGAATDGRLALIMHPLLRRSLLEVFEGLTEPLAREKLALSAARQYVDLLQAMAQANLSCLDRKLGDLWWVGDPETGQLIVTDWNVVSETPNQVMDLRRFGLLWFELVIGRQMPRDFQPNREDFEQIQDKLSYGLWHVIGRAVGSSMGPQFHPLPELTEVLGDLAMFFTQSPQALTRQARDNLQEAQSHLDRGQADLAWIQFDLAQRLDPGRPVAGLQQARLWAYDPVAQAAPDLVKKLSSPQFSEALSQLQELKRKTQRAQELGDVERLQFGFDLLNAAKDALIKGSTTDLAQMGQEFAEVQDLLVEGVLHPLMAKDGLTARKHLEKLPYLLPENLSREGMDKLHSLTNEALFWVAYQEMQQNLQTRPDLAIKALERVRATRDLIDHWPPSYEPTLEDLDRLQMVIEVNLRSTILTDDAETITGDSGTAEAGPVASQAISDSISHFRLILEEYLGQSGWGEGIAELLTRLEMEPDNEEVNTAVEQMLQHLMQKRLELAENRPSPGRLRDRAGILKFLLQIPVGFSPELPSEQSLRQELAEIRHLERQIAWDQQELFQNPGEVLARALAGDYELFDDAGLAVAVLKVVHEAGRWDYEKFNQEVIRLEEQAQRFLVLTNLLAERRQNLEQTLAFHQSWSAESSAAETHTFLTNTLRLYLTTAQTQLQAGEDATQALTRASRLLEQAAQSLVPADYTPYQDLYEHLLVLSNGNLASETLPLPIETQLETWFKAYRFEDCQQALTSLASESQKKKWEARLNDALQFRNLLAQGEPQPENSYFRKKQNVQNYAEALETLCRQIEASEPMAYELYQEELANLYERTWQRLDQLDRKLAREFEPSIRIGS